MIQSLFRSRGRRVALSFLGLLLGALLLEVATRAVIRVTHSLEPMVPVVIGRFDERLGWALQPNASAASRRSGSTIYYRINSKGLRDDETSYEKPPGIFRIVLLGDSNTFGHGVPIEKHFSTLLEASLRHVEVINMGVNGYGVDQELLYLRHEGFKYTPDLVLTYVPHYSEQRHMHPRRFGQNKPRFEERGEQLVLSNYPVEYSLILPRSLLPLHRWCVNRSKLCELVHARAAMLIRDSLHQASRDIGPNENHMTGVSRPPTETDTHKLGARIVHEMASECKALGISFAVVTRVASLHKAMLTGGQQSLDISKALADEKFRIPGDNHDNEAANRVLTSEIARFLQASGLVPGKHFPESP